MGHMEHMAIEWREINPDYIVSSDGQVGSRKFGRLRILKQSIYDGYPRVPICVGGIERKRKVHQLVAEAFLPPKPTPRHQVNHKNGNRSDNRDANLEWVTPGENQRHGYVVLGRVNNMPFGENAPAAKLTKQDVADIRKRLSAGETQKSIGAIYGVTQSNIGFIARGITWAKPDTRGCV